MWPLILKKVKSIIESTNNTPIIVVEAAVLLSANWQKDCHEIWASIIPPDEVNPFFIYYQYIYL